MVMNRCTNWHYARPLTYNELVELSGPYSITQSSVVVGQWLAGLIHNLRIHSSKDVRQGKSEVYTSLVLQCTSLGANVNTRRMSKPDVESIFHIRNQ